MTYDPNVPTGVVPLNIDYQNLQNNFQALDTVFAVDHVTYSNATPQRGYHTSIHMNPVSSGGPVVPPAATPNYGQIFSESVNDNFSTDTTLYFLTGGNKLIQLTRNVQPSAAINGYTFFPGGIIFQWGRVTNPGSGGSVTFPQSFKAALFNIQLTIQDDSGNQRAAVRSTIPPTLTGFNYFCSSSGIAFLYWTAIGN